MASENPFDLLSDDPKPWHRQRATGRDGKLYVESVEAHQAFRMYCELDDARSIVKVAFALGKTRHLLERWSKKWSWQERSRLYDSHMYDQRIATIIGERVAMAERQARIGMAGQDVAEKLLAEVQDRIRKFEVIRKAWSEGAPLPDIYQATLDQIARLMDVSCKLERIARGAPDGIDPDAVAQINVTVQLQPRPRYAEVTDEDEEKKEWQN